MTTDRLNCLLLVSCLAIPLAQASSKVALDAQLPSFFEPNRGQAPSEVRFLAHGQGISLLLEDRVAVLRLPSSEVRMHLTGPARTPQAIEPLDPLPGTTNYFIGNKAAAWRTGIPQTGRIRYKQVYPGIDLVFKAGASSRFEYDFVIAPQADPSRIGVRFDGAQSVESDRNGGIILHTKSGDIRQPRPKIYQDVDSGRREISGSMILAGDNTVRFDLGAYDRTRALVIDPLIIQYLIGNVDDQFSSIARDSAGNVYVAGNSGSMLTKTPFGPAASGFYHPFIIKLTPDLSTILYVAVMGGTMGEDASSVAVDSSGSAYLIGTTHSSDFPTTQHVPQPSFGNKQLINISQEDAFILKLDPKGATLVYSTYLGGNAADPGNVLTIDSAGAVYAAGSTTSSNFPITPGGLHLGLTFVSGTIYQSNWIAKLSADGSLFNWVAAVGGNTSVTNPTGIALDSSSNVYLVGTVQGTDYPTMGKPVQPTLPQNCTNCYSGFISEVNNKGNTLMASTYWGGSLTAGINSVALDAQNNVYIAGFAYSTDLPFTKNTIVPPPANEPPKGAAYVASLNSSLSAVLACTYLAGDSSVANTVLVRAPGVIGVSGGSLSGSFATIQPQPGLSATGGAYVELDPLFQHVLRSFSPLPYAVDYSGAAAAPDGSVAMGNTTQLLPTTSGLQVVNRNGVVILVFPGPVNPNAPVISSGGVVSASSFGAFPTVSPGSWIEIYGSNLAADTRQWANSDFTGLNAPMSLDGTSVIIGSQSAFIDYISPTQVNALVSSSTPTGAQQLIIKTAQGTSAAYNVTVNAAQPGLLAPPSFKIGGVQYAVAILSDGAYALPTGAIAGVNSRPAKPGDVLVLYGVGFGSVSPNIPAGQVVQQANSITQPFQMSLGGTNATLAYDGLAPNFTGL